MSTDEKIGLLPHVGWLVSDSFVLQVLILLFVTIGVMMVLAEIAEDRTLALTSGFKSFFPGDIFLSIAGALLLQVATKLPAEDRWYNHPLTHIIIQVGGLAVAVVMTRNDDEARGGIYPRHSVYSPTHLYHNIVLYGVLGYMLVSTLVAVLFGMPWTGTNVFGLLVALAVAAPWLVLVLKDGGRPREELVALGQIAHPRDWRPIWKRPRAR